MKAVSDGKIAQKKIDNIWAKWYSKDCKKHKGVPYEIVVWYGDAR